MLLRTAGREMVLRESFGYNRRFIMAGFQTGEGEAGGQDGRGLGGSSIPQGRRGGTYHSDLELKETVAIIGGASEGLGRACAEALAHEGVKLAICSRTQADLEKAAQ